MRDNSHFSNWETRLLFERIVTSHKLRTKYFSLATRFYEGYPLDKIVYDMHVELLGEEQQIHRDGRTEWGATNEWEPPNYWEILGRLIDALRESGTLEKR